MGKSYLFLSVAIIAEVIATSMLKSSNEFSKLVPTIVVFTGYGVAFYFMTLALRSIPIGITYAIWSGVGTALIAIIGTIVYKQKMDLPAIVGILFIISGVVIINLFSNKIH